MITGTRALKELGEVWTAKPEEIVPAVILQIKGIFRVNQLSRRREKIENCGLCMMFALLLKISSTLGIFSPEQCCDFSWQHELTRTLFLIPHPSSILNVSDGPEAKNWGTYLLSIGTHTDKTDICSG